LFGSTEIKGMEILFIITVRLVQEERKLFFLVDRGKKALIWVMELILA
jgi:hypothetical protein